MMKELCKNFKVEHQNSSPYRPKMNGVVEAANKNIKKIMKNMVETYKDWHEMLLFSLHGYRTSKRTSIRETTFSLFYGIDAVLPVEIDIPSLRILTDVKLDEVECVQARFDQLNLIDEKRFASIFHDQLYQKCLKRAFDKKVFPRSIKVGDLVLRNILLIHTGPRFSGGVLILTSMDDEDLPSPVNVNTVKKHYA